MIGLRKKISFFIKNLLCLLRLSLNRNSLIYLPSISISFFAIAVVVLFVGLTSLSAVNATSNNLATRVTPSLTSSSATTTDVTFVTSTPKLSTANAVPITGNVDTTSTVINTSTAVTAATPTFSPTTTPITTAIANISPTSTPSISPAATSTVTTIPTPVNSITPTVVSSKSPTVVVNYNPTLSVTPNIIHSGESILIKGTGWRSLDSGGYNNYVNISFLSSASGKLLRENVIYIEINNDGSLSHKIFAPLLPEQNVLIMATDTYNQQAQIALTVLPPSNKVTLEVTPGAAEPGNSVKVKGTGWFPKTLNGTDTNYIYISFVSVNSGKILRENFASLKIDSNGVVDDQLVVAVLANEDLLIVGKDSYGREAQAPLKVLPVPNRKLNLTVSPGSASGSSLIQINGSGWNPKGLDGYTNTVIISAVNAGSGKMVEEGFGHLSVKKDGTIDDQIGVPLLPEQEILIVAKDDYNQQAQVPFKILALPQATAAVCPNPAPENGTRTNYKVVKYSATEYYVCVQLVRGLADDYYGNLADVEIYLPKNSTASQIKASFSQFNVSDGILYWGRFQLLPGQTATLTFLLMVPDGAFPKIEVDTSYYASLPDTRYNPVLKVALQVGTQLEINSAGWNPKSGDGQPNEVTIKLFKQGEETGKNSASDRSSSDSALATLGTFSVNADGSFVAKVSLPPLQVQVLLIIATDRNGKIRGATLNIATKQATVNSTPIEKNQPSVTTPTFTVAASTTNNSQSSATTPTFTVAASTNLSSVTTSTLTVTASATTSDRTVVSINIPTNPIGLTTPVVTSTGSPITKPLPENESAPLSWWLFVIPIIGLILGLGGFWLVRRYSAK